MLQEFISSVIPCGSINNKLNRTPKILWHSGYIYRVHILQCIPIRELFILLGTALTKGKVFKLSSNPDGPGIELFDQSRHVSIDISDELTKPYIGILLFSISLKQWGLWKTCSLIRYPPQFTQQPSAFSERFFFQGLVFDTISREFNDSMLQHNIIYR